MSPWRIKTFSDFAEARRILEPWLLAREPENGLIIGILRALESGKHDYESPVLVTAVMRDKELVGCAYRAPPYKLGLTEIPLGAMPALAREVAAHYDWIPAVLGPKMTTIGFAAAWTRIRHCEARGGMLQRIYAARKVTAPSSAPGRMRPASMDDLELLIAWTSAFVQESGLQPVNYDERVRGMIEDQALFVWEDSAPRSMMGAVAPTDNGIRIGYVYTPPEYRKKGYASAGTAALTERMLQQYDFCTLYTDLSNPTSNSLYQRIGYERVADVMDVNFVPGAQVPAPPPVASGDRAPESVPDPRPTGPRDNTGS
jgi:ribosomal protein S18 acetylase RimI-like enzyme